LILHQGRRLLFGPIGEVRAQFADLAPDATLEEVFFRATESEARPDSPFAQPDAAPGE
jgi:hypothetical protein